MTGGLAVAFSGGGAKGAFQAGVLSELAKEGITFDMFVGVSTGSIQALGGAMGKIDELIDYWESITGDADIYMRRSLLDFPLAILPQDGLFPADGEYDQIPGQTFADSIPGLPTSLHSTAPLQGKLRKFAEDNWPGTANVKPLRIGVVSLQTGDFRAIHEDAPGIADWVYASCAVPLEFKPHLATAQGGGKTQWVDGGVRDVTPLTTALEMRPRAVFVVRASPPPQVLTHMPEFKNLLSIALRAAEILEKENSVTDILPISLINDILTAQGAVAANLAAQGLSSAQIDAAMAPLKAVATERKFAPIYYIRPEVEYARNHEFRHDKIRAAIEGGRLYVRNHLAEIQTFLSDNPAYSGGE